MLQPLELKAALNLAALVLEFEAENSQADEWRAEVRRAKLAIDQALKRPPAGEFFISAKERPNKKNNHINQVEESQAMLNNRTKVVKFLGEARTKSLEMVLEAISKAADEAGIEKKEVGEAARQAAYLAALDVLLEQMDQLIGQFYGSPVADKSKPFDLLTHLNNISKAAKDTPSGRKAAQPSGPLFAGNQAGIANLLHKGSDFSGTLAVAAAQTKAKNYNGGSKQ